MPCVMLGGRSAADAYEFVQGVASRLGWATWRRWIGTWSIRGGNFPIPCGFCAGAHSPG